MESSDSDSDSDSELHPLPAIHEAVRALDIDALRRALEDGASIDQEDEGGWTPLYRACADRGFGRASDYDSNANVPEYWHRVADRVAVVRVLLNNGAEPNVRCTNDSYSGESPLHAAALDHEFPSSDIVTWLIAAGGDVNAVDQGQFSVLYVAAQNGRTETVSQLIAAGADIHRKWRDTYTPLMGARICGKVRNYAPLLRAGAALPPANRVDAYLDKIAATPGGFPAYEREHRRRLTAVFTNKFPMLPVDVISHIVLLWAHLGDYLYSDAAPAPPAESLIARRRAQHSATPSAPAAPV